MSDLLRSKSTKSPMRAASISQERSKFEKAETVRRVQSLRVGNSEKNIKNRNDSSGALEELVQCGICFERLSEPRMLPCQHTFCRSCLETHIIAKNLVVTNPSLSDVKQALEKTNLVLSCIICKKELILNHGLNSLEDLPSNLYINSLLTVLNKNSNTSNMLSNNAVRCVKCQIICQSHEHKCQHCEKIFCLICWPEHIDELKNKLPDFLKQLTDSEHRLNLKSEDYEKRKIQLNETVANVTEEKIATIKDAKENILKQIESASLDAKLSYKELTEKLSNAKNDINVFFSIPSIGDPKQVHSYIQMHQDISKLLDEVSLWGETRLIFDPDSFELEEDEPSLNFIDDQILMNSNPLESKEHLEAYYKNCSFESKLVWNRCPKSAGIGISPWSPSLLYIAAFVSKKVIILDRHNKKVIGNLTHEEMLCPYSITFREDKNEIFISDKWKHCIHVFSNDNVYLRNICSRGHKQGQVLSPQGISITPNGNLVLCDTGNNRVLVLNSENGSEISTIGSDLNMPTDVAVSNDKIVIADAGNNRIKIYNLVGDKIREFGFAGCGKGQFRLPEVVAIDALGFILVGDSGNARIQIFDENGIFIRMLYGSSNDKFKWISGLTVSPELSIIATDYKGKSLQIF